MMAQTTKRALAASLKKLLRDKPLDKITVVDIAEDCGVNRQTFYYHFQDIYALVEWIFTSEAAEALDGKRTYDTWQQGFLQIFEYALAQKALVMNAYRSISREYLEAFFYRVTYGLLIGVVEEMAQGMAVREDDKAFIADFYKYAFVGLVLDWIKKGMREDPGRIVARLSILIEGDIAKALNKFRRQQE